jgi:hypothetical protein
MLVYWLDIVGTIVFAVSGVLLAGKLRMDSACWFWASLPPWGRNDSRYGARQRPGILGERPHRPGRGDGDLYADDRAGASTAPPAKWVLPVLDAVGLAVFVGIGVNKAFIAHSGPLVAVCMGVVTGVGGGIIRDVLAREVPMILRTEIYATACIIGGIVRDGLLHLQGTAGKRQYDGDGGDAGHSPCRHSLAPQAADLCTG